VNVLMFTNTYAPHVGGVARSVERLAAELRRKGHTVWIAAPEFEDMPKVEQGVLRFPAVQRFNGSDFSVPMPVPRRLSSLLKHFRPDVVHSHHPFLLGDMALRVAAAYDAPLVFTHHTFYELYTHYVPGDSPALKRFVIELASGYCNLCDAVIAPSDSVKKLLCERGVKVPIEVIPTGLDPPFFAPVSRSEARAAMGIPNDAFVVGHVGRLAPEKNISFLTEVLERFLLRKSDAHLLIAGEGPSREAMIAALGPSDLQCRIHFAGVLSTEELVRAYRAMDVFAFASKSETQGMVLTEAMAAGVPIVALDAPGAADVVRDCANGRLLQSEEPERFAEALAWIASLDRESRERLARNAEDTARAFSLANLADRVLGLYLELGRGTVSTKRIDRSAWSRARCHVREEWRILKNVARAASDAWLTRTF
jgi:1,2-diacylglycerol 3-alpha-glucosyltransferase